MEACSAACGGTGQPPRRHPRRGDRLIGQRPPAAGGAQPLLGHVQRDLGEDGAGVEASPLVGNHGRVSRRRSRVDHRSMAPRCVSCSVDDRDVGDAMRASRLVVGRGGHEHRNRLGKVQVGDHVDRPLVDVHGTRVHGRRRLVRRRRCRAADRCRARPVGRRRPRCRGCRCRRSAVRAAASTSRRGGPQRARSPTASSSTTATRGPDVCDLVRAPRQLGGPGAQVRCCHVRVVAGRSPCVRAERRPAPQDVGPRTARAGRTRPRTPRPPRARLVPPVRPAARRLPASLATLSRRRRPSPRCRPRARGRSWRRRRRASAAQGPLDLPPFLGQVAPSVGSHPRRHSPARASSSFACAATALGRPPRPHERDRGVPGRAQPRQQARAEPLLASRVTDLRWRPQEGRPWARRRGVVRDGMNVATDQPPAPCPAGRPSSPRAAAPSGRPRRPARPAADLLSTQATCEPKTPR